MPVWLARVESSGQPLRAVQSQPARHLFRQDSDREALGRAIDLLVALASSSELVERDQIIDASTIIKSAMEGIDDDHIEEIAEQAVNAAFDRDRTRVFILHQLGVALEQIDNLNERVERLVHIARQCGATWAEVGEVADVTPQAAMRRWDAQAREKHAAYQRQKRATST